MLGLLLLLLASETGQGQTIITDDYVFWLSPSVQSASAGDTVTVDVYLQVRSTATAIDPAIFNDGFSYGVCHDQALLSLDWVVEGNWIDFLDPCQEPESNIKNIYADGFTQETQFASVGSDWLPQDQLLNQTASADDLFGDHVAVSEDTILVGAPGGVTQFSGGHDQHVTVYEQVNLGGCQTQPPERLPEVNPPMQSVFGGYDCVPPMGYGPQILHCVTTTRSIAISGNRAVVGFPYGPSGPSHVTPYERIAGTWQREDADPNTPQVIDRLIQPNPPSPVTSWFGEFGKSLDISGDTMVVSAYDPTPRNWPGALHQGVIYVYERLGGIWQPPVEILDPEFPHSQSVNCQSLDPCDFIGPFGWSVAISGNTIVAGNPMRDGNVDLAQTGNAWVFEKIGSNWQPVTMLGDPADPWYADQYGYSVDISGDTIVVGAPKATGGENPALPIGGSIYIFERDISGTWQFQAELFHPEDIPYNCFGASVAISDSTIVVGTPNPPWQFDPPGTVRTGSAVVFERDSQGGWSQPPVVLSDPNGEPGDDFGAAVAVDGCKIVVGAPHDDTPFGINSGSTWVFECNKSGCELPVCTHLVAQATYTCLTDVVFDDSVVSFCETLGSPPVQVTVTENGVCYDPQTDFFDRPFALDCSLTSPGEMALTWNSEGIFEFVEVVCDGSVVAALDGDEKFYQHSFTPGAHVCCSIVGYLCDSTIESEPCCVPCIETSEDEITCDGASGGYSFTFDLTNLSGVTAHKAVFLSEVPTTSGSATVTTNIWVFDPALDHETTSQVTIGIEDGVAGDTVTIPFALMHKNADGSVEECCSDEISVVFPACGGVEFVRGDINRDGGCDIADAIKLLEFLFVDGACSCMDACDCNDDGAVDIADAICKLSFLFSGGPPPPAPYPGCGLDPTPDNLDCLSFPPCE